MEGVYFEARERLSGVEGPVNNLNVDDFDLNDSDREEFENLVDILFVVDSTGSMSSYIKDSIFTICKIVEKFKKQEYDLKFSLCDYRDHPPQEASYVTHFEDLCNGKAIVEKLNKLSAQGGGDQCEAVMDGLREGLTKTSWRKTVEEKASQRFLFHVCDAPPHGKEYGGSSSDRSWSENGCPCGTKKEDIRDLLVKQEVKYFLIKPCEGIGYMETLFKETFSTSYGDTINIGKQQLPENERKKRCSKTAKCKREKEELCKEGRKEEDEEEEDEEEFEEEEESEEPLSKVKEESGDSCAMWKGVLDAIDKNMV